MLLCRSPESQKMFFGCADFQAIRAAVGQSSVIPKKRMGFSVRKACVAKRLKISDEVAQRVVFRRSEESVENPRHLTGWPSFFIPYVTRMRAAFDGEQHTTIAISNA